MKRNIVLRIGNSNVRALSKSLIRLRVSGPTVLHVRNMEDGSVEVYLACGSPLVKVLSTEAVGASNEC